jgi:hypothetical protein
VPFGSIRYEHTADVLVLAAVSSRTVGRPYTPVGAFRFVARQAEQYRQSKWSGNKYTRLPKPDPEHAVYSAPDWATKADIKYIIKALGCDVQPEGVTAADYLVTEEFPALMSEAFKAYNSGDMDEFLDKYRFKTSRGGKWGWE